MKQTILFCILILLAGSACQLTGLVAGGAATPGAAPASTLPSVTQSGASALANPGSPVPSPSAAPTAVPSPTTVPQPVFDPNTVASLDSLKSYSLQSSYRLQKGEQPGADTPQRLDTFSVTRITDQQKAHVTTTSLTSGLSKDQNHKYIDDWYYLGEILYRITSGQQYWLIDTNNKNGAYYLNPFKSLEEKSARFVSEEDYHGVQANHFVFDQNDLVPFTPEPGYKLETFTGNIYLTKDGNLPLHFDFKSTGNIWWERVKKGDNYETVYSPGSADWSIDLGQINQVNSIDFPPDAPTQVSLQVDVPMPQGCTLHDIMVFSGKPPYDYTFTCAQSLEEIFTFYQQLQPPTGWSVNTVAQQGNSRMAVLNKGAQLVILSIRYSSVYKENTIDFQYDPSK